MNLPLAPRHLKRYVQVGRLFARHWNRARALAEDPQSAADGPSLAEDLEELGPTWVKLGQNLSTRPDVVPEPIREELERLRQDVEPVPFADIKARIEEELGAAIGDLFSSFDESPLGAASLAQVHAAALRDGRPVAVKVQRPDAREQVTGDLDVLRDVADWLENHTDLERRHGLASTLRDFDGALRRELDYTEEADNLRRMGEIAAPYPTLVVPDLVDDYSTNVVLTMQRLDGAVVGKLSPVARLEGDLTQLAEDLFRCYLDQGLVHGFVHADPHPGNIVLTRDRRLGLLDLGMVTIVPGGLQKHLLLLLLAVADGDDAEAARVAERVGTQLDDYDGDAFRGALARMVGRHQGAAIGSVPLGALVMDLVRVAGRAGLRLPAQLGLLGKTLLNLQNVVDFLDPYLDPSDVLRRHAVEVIGERLADDLSPSVALRKGLHAKQMAQALPGRLDDILETLGSGAFEVGVRLKGEEPIVTAVTKVANRLTQGVVLAALVVGASLLMQVETSFTLLGYPGLAIILFLLATIGGLRLVWIIGLRDPVS